MTKLTHHFVRIVAALSSVGMLACPAGDDGDTGADTGTLSTSVSTTMTSTTMTSTTNATEDPTNATEDPTNATEDPTNATEDPTADTGNDCTPDDECMDDSMCPGGSCIGCLCIGGAETMGGGDCPAGETCQMTGAGGMACLGEATHCVLACGGAMACPDSMECQGGACQYDAMNLPAMGDPNYPVPMANMCPEGFLAVSFTMNYVVCIPECDGMGQMAACVQGASGSAVGACLTNPMSSGMACEG